MKSLPSITKTLQTPSFFLDFYFELKLCVFPQYETYNPVKVEIDLIGKIHLMNN